MYGRCGKLIARSGKREEFIAILQRAADLVGELPGCRLYAVGADQNDDQAIWVLEIWTDAAAHEASLQDLRVRSLIAEARPLMGGPPEGAALASISGHGLAPAVLQLRAVEEADLSLFFAQQQDPVANRMAAFTAREPNDRAAFDDHWRRILGDDTIVIRTILFDGQVAGYVLSHQWFGQPEVSYWLGREFWGLGIASRSLAHFLKEQTTRPLYGRAAADNRASIRVLEKCGFRHAGTERSFANARGTEIDEVLMVLEKPPAVTVD